MSEHNPIPDRLRTYYGTTRGKESLQQNGQVYDGYSIFATTLGLLLDIQERITRIEQHLGVNEQK